MVVIIMILMVIMLNVVVEIWKSPLSIESWIRTSPEEAGKRPGRGETLRNEGESVKGKTGCTQLQIKKYSFKLATSSVCMAVGGTEPRAGSRRRDLIA